MSDPMPNPRFAFAGHLTAIGSLVAGAGITLMPKDDLALATVIARKGQAGVLGERVQALFGIPLPARPKRAAAGKIAFIGTGPGQWLAIEESSGDPQSFAAKLATEFAGSGSVCDQSDGRAVIRVSGPRARHVLAKGLPVDLHPRAFGPGDAALSQIALISTLLWQIDEAPTYEIAVFRSMAGSFADWLIASGAEYGIAAMS
ncbi:MAG: sarcosine oxidase gamma subunit [Rhodospirillales bacterium]|nr:sarcosine oxidase gamma subunit [Rhodospirillales bacterium]